MNKIEYVSFSEINPDDFSSVLNDDALRKHLMPHACFDAITIRDWMSGKVQCDSMPGCRVRAVLVNGDLAGWCGIQAEGNEFEMAVVIGRQYWGLGLSVFRTLIVWAKELQHQVVVFHLLGSRPQYRFLKRKALKVKRQQLWGRNFTSYWISVADW